MTRGAVIKNTRQARRYLELLRRQLPVQAALVQEFLPGSECGLDLIYSGLSDGMPPIPGYESKTDPASPYWTAIWVRAAGLEPEAGCRPGRPRCAVQSSASW